MNFGEKVLDLLYPPRCPVCHDILQPGRTFICDSCVQYLPFVREPVCKKCGKPLESDEEELCFDCQKLEHEFTQGIGVFLYDDIMRKSLHYFKYQGRVEYGEFYARCMWKHARPMIEVWKPEVIVPVPVHKMRYRERGYNQAEVVADRFSKIAGIPVEKGYIIRREKTRAQKDLTPEERRENLQKAFEPGKRAVDCKRILLIDDIYTTGSTMDAVSKILREGGAEEIYALSICIGKGFMVQ